MIRDAVVNATRSTDAPKPESVQAPWPTFRRPSIGALLLALIPFVGTCFSVALWDRVQPFVFGLPFNLFWLLCWVVLGSACLRAAYWVENSRQKEEEKNR